MAAKALARTDGWIDAHVPGSVQHDLWRAGMVDDPYVGRNSLAVEWVATRTWVYHRTFEGESAWAGRRLRLRFEGVDYAARFTLNGVDLGVHESMSTPALFDVTGLLRDDAPNDLSVVFAPAPDEQDQMGRTSLVRSRKTRMGYWWDFCPRMVNVGLWDAVSLEVDGPVRIEDVWVRPALDAGRDRAHVSVALIVSALEQQRARVDLTIRDPDGLPVASASIGADLPIGEHAIEMSAIIENPHLWWPNGYGDQPLYHATVTVASVDHPLEDPGQRSVTFGLRTVEVTANATDDPTAPPYTFIVNGRRVYINGWNWVPLDALYGVEQPDKLDAALELARRAHVNLLRVNGVGVIERADFYERCDRMGLMVWQEFLVTSSEQDRKPSEDPAYLADVVAEARRIVPRRRNHPSLVIWCAGNELEGGDKLPLDDSEPLIGALRLVAAELDPDRHWLPTSPLGRKPFNGLSSIRRDPDGLHDVHGPWLYEGLEEQYTLFNEGPSLLHSEFAVEGLTNIETLRDVFPPDELHLDRLHSPAWRHLSAWWVRPELWREWLGVSADLESLVEATQMLQAEGVRYAIESNRRRIPRNSGSLPWQFNEPYPMAAGTSAIDYYARPKALYFAVEEGYRPVSVSARYDTVAWGGRTAFEADLWVVSALPVPVADALLEARLIDATGSVHRRVTAVADVQPSRPVTMATISHPLESLEHDVFFLDLRLSSADGSVLAHHRRCFSRQDSLAPLAAVETTELVIEVERGDDVWRAHLRNEGEHAAMFVRTADARPVRAAGNAFISASHLCLLPGEATEVEIEWRGVPAESRAVSMGGWNTARHIVRGDQLQDASTRRA
jgi:beta-mannosidase